MTHRFHALAFVLALSACLPCASCARGDSAAARSASAEELDPTSQTVFGDRLLLFLEHPHLVRGEHARFLVHLTVSGTGEPVRSGRAILEVGTSRFAAEAPKRDGLFVAEGSLPAAGRFESRLVVESGAASEILALEEMVVHPDRGAAKTAADAAGADPQDVVPFLMEQQWKVQLIVAEARPRRLVSRLTVPAQVVTPEGREAVVSPPAAGRLLLATPPPGRLPRSGEHVEAGQVLAQVEPPLGAPELAQLRSLQMELELKVLEIARVAHEAEARLRLAEQERERTAKLQEKGLSTRQALDRAEHDLVVARGAMESARATKAFVEALRQERASSQAADRPNGLRLPLVAPIRGTLVAAARVEGESVGAGVEVFRIVDASRVWIEGRISEFDLARLGPLPEADATFAALPGRRVVVGGQDMPAYLGPRVDPESRTLVIRYEIENADGQVRPGMLAELAIALASVESAVAIPQAAVVRDRGLPTAYVMLEGELFQKRDLELGIEDGGFVEVRRGIVPGERVATRGSHIVRLAALSPASFGAGHQH